MIWDFESGLRLVCVLVSVSGEGDRRETILYVSFSKEGLPTPTPHTLGGIFPDGISCGEICISALIVALETPKKNTTADLRLFITKPKSCERLHNPLCRRLFAEVLPI